MSEKLIFPIGFDLEEGVAQVEKDWGVVQRRLQKTIDGKPLTIKVDSKGLEQFGTYSDNMRNSINKIREAMKELDETWNSMSDFEKFDEGGDLTSGAQELVQKYNELTVALQTYGKTLSQIASEAKRQAEEEVKALERKEQAQIKANRAAYDAQVRAGQQAVVEQEKNRADYEKLVADYAKREQAETRLTQRGLQYEQERIRLKQQAQQASDKEYENLVRQIKAEQQLASNQANRARQASYNAARKQGLERMRILNAEEKSIDAINRKLQIQQQRLQSTDMGSAKFQKIAAEVKRLTEELDKANARVAQLTGRATQGADQHTRAVERTNEAYKRQGGYLSRLFQRMVAYASVAQAFSFVRNIRDVTAEFELQRVALGSIIGDLNEANAMFEQIKAAAVKSPFQIKELVTYTKNLAAYKIPADELFETTQRLADISAGLGVGMERLVLAYGQIRATGYLRASEVRQLTEAGIPIVEELAKKMSQLRGETVSAAEVMGMISERAISFGMVKEVFDDMTSAGGMFYKMQEKQAETLAGQWSNLQDAIAIMYEEIGNTEGVNNSIKGTIGLVKSLAENWRVVASVLGSVAISIGATKLASLFIPTLVVNTKKVAQAEEQLRIATERRIAAQQRGGRVGIWVAKSQEAAARATLNAAEATTKFGRAWSMLKGMFKGGGWIGLAVTLVSALATWFISARKEAKRLNEELAKIGTEGALQADQSVRNFERLANTIRESADGSREQSEALAELKRTYGDLLPTQDKEILALVKVKEGYEDVTTAIREKINAQIYEQKMNTIISEYGTNLANKQKKPKKWLENMGFSTEETTRIFNAIDKAVQEGLINSQQSVLEQTRTIEKIIKDSTGKVVNLTTQYSSGITNAYKNVYEGQKLTRLALELRNLVGVYSDFNNSVNELADSQKRASNITWEYQQGYDELHKSIKKANEGLDSQKFADAQKMTQNALEQYRIHIKKLVEDELGKGTFNVGVGSIIDFEKGEKTLAKLPANLRAYINEIRKEYEKLVPTDITRLANDKLQEYADKVGISMDDVKEHLKTNEQSTEDWAKGLKGSYESVEKKLAEYKKNQDAFSKQGAPFRDWSEDIEETTKEMKVLKLLMDFFKEFLKGGDTKQRKSQLSILQEELQLHEKIYAKYKEYRQYMSAEEAKKKVSEYFKDTIGDLKFAPSFDKDGYKNVLTQYQGAIKDLLAKAKDETERGAIKKVLLELGFKIDDKDWEETKDNMEKNLKKLSDDLSRTKTAKEFFDRMLGLTGDKQLSATLTLSVYGTTGDDLKSALVKQVQGAFAGQDLSKAINTDLNSIDISALREIYNNLPEDFQEKQKQSMKQVLDMLEKGQHDLANNFAKLLMDYDEMEQKRVTITQKAAQEIATLEQGLQAQIEGIRQNKEITDKDSAIADATARAEAVRKAILAREKLELSKLSPEYIRFFSSINAMAMETANSTRTQLRRALFDAFEQGGISAEELRKELKAIDTQFNKLNENATLFSSYATGGFDAWLQKLQQSADELDAIAARMMKLESIDQMDEGDKNFVNKMLRVFGGKGQKSLSDLATSFNGDMSQMGDAVQKVGGQMQGMFSSATGAILIVDAIIKGIGQTIDGVGQVIDQINSMRSEDNQIGGWFKYIQDFNKYAQAGWEDLKSGNIAGALANTVSSIISIFQNIQADKIKKLNKEIERQQELLDNLAYSYERLEKAQEKAFGSDYISNYEQRLANLQAQQDAYLKQAEKERSKGKKADSDKIEEYEEQARDTADAIEDMQSELSEYFLGTDLTSAARDFANAWIDAYKEFGSTTDAMKEKFQEMIQNMIVNSMAAKIMETALQPFYDEVEKLAKDGDLSIDDMAKLGQMSADVAEDMNVGMENWVNAMRAAGYDIRSTASGLTGISRDIATASEESILGLAAGINTQNFYISQVPTKLDVIIGLLQGGNPTQGSAITLQDLVTIQNQHLSHLPSIAQHTADTVAECKRTADACEVMVNKLNSVIKPQGTEATHRVATILSNK